MPQSLSFFAIPSNSNLSNLRSLNQSLIGKLANQSRRNECTGFDDAFGWLRDLQCTTVVIVPRQEPQHNRGMTLFNKYEPTGDQGGGRISQYLHHCTQKRTVLKTWSILEMVGEIEPLLSDLD